METLVWSEGRAATVICNQAERLGYDAELEQAGSGSCYLRVSHPQWCKCDAIDDCDGFCVKKLIRVANHEPNEARYVFGVNERPDVCVEVGFQADAVRMLARWIGVDPESLPYLKATNTRLRRKREKLEAQRRAFEQREEERVAKQRAKFASTASAEDRRKLAYYETLRGKRRKRYGNRQREALERAAWDDQV